MVGSYLTNRVTTGTTSGNIGSITAAEEITAFAVKPIWSCALSPHTVTNVRYWMGLYDSALNGSDSPTANFAAFRASTAAGDTTYKFVTGDNSGSITVTDTGVSFTADTPHEFRINMSGYPSSVTGTIDGTAVATSSTHLPGSSSQFYQSPTVETLTSAAAAADVGFIVCASEGSAGSGGGGAVSSVSASDSTLTVTPTTGAVTVKISSSVALAGSPTTTTQTSGDNTTKIATTAFVQSALGSVGSAPDPMRRVYFNEWSEIGSNEVTQVGSRLVTGGLGTSALATTVGGQLILTNVTSTGSYNLYYLTPVENDWGCGGVWNANGSAWEPLVSVGGKPILQVACGLARSTNVMQFVGLCNTNLVMWPSTQAIVLAGTPASGCYFRYSTYTTTADTTYKCICNDGTTSTIVDSGVTADTNLHVFKVDCSSGASAIFSIDGSVVATINTNMPTSTTALGVFAMMFNDTHNYYGYNMTLGKFYVESY